MNRKSCYVEVLSKDTHQRLLDDHPFIWVDPTDRLCAAFSSNATTRSGEVRTTVAISVIVVLPLVHVESRESCFLIVIATI